MIELIQTDSGVLLRIAARAGARRNEVRGEHAGALKVSVTAAPEKGKANHAILDLLCDALGLSRTSVELVAGATSRQKQVRVCGVPLADLRRRIEVSLDNKES